MGVWGQVIANIKRFTRDKTALFFTFLFPLIFLFVFGSIFNDQTAKFNIAILNNSNSDFAKQFVDGAENDPSDIFTIKKVTGIDDAKEKLKRSEIDGIIELPQDFGEVRKDSDRPMPSGTITVLYAKGREQSGSTLQAVLEGIINQINFRMGHPQPPLSVSSQAVGDAALRQFDYTFTGLLAFSLMSMGIFGLAHQMPGEKKRGSYRQLKAAPFTSGQLIIAYSIFYTMIALLSIITMVIVGMLAFKFTMRGDWLLFALFTIVSAIMMVGFGLMIGAWAKNESQAAPLTNLLSFPMMFLSGAFFPSFLFPDWLRAISQFVPMTPVVDGLRSIVTEHATFIDMLPKLGFIMTVIIIVYAISIKAFRWE